MRSNSVSSPGTPGKGGPSQESKEEVPSTTQNSIIQRIGMSYLQVISIVGKFQFH
jgi:hypothetical protein